jgi:hypothetical protein
MPTAGGFRLSTALPFLRADAEVDIVLSPDARVSVRGWISGIALDPAHDDGSPHLVIHVRVGEPEPAPMPAAADIDARTPPATDIDARTPPATTVEATDVEATEIVHIRDLPVPEPPRPRRRPLGLLVGAAALVGASAVWLSWSGVFHRRSIAPPPLPSAAPAVIVEPIAPVTVPAAPAEPGAASATVEPASVADRAAFVVGLVGSLSGARRYPLSAPDGVAFNLPHARATLKVGTYRPPVDGLRAVWVRALPGGGTHLRFFYGGAHPPPEVQLLPDGARVFAR